VIDRPACLERLTNAVRRSPVTVLLGPRQCGKTTLAREFAAGRPSVRFDLESLPDLERLRNPELVLGALEGLVVLDEIQVMPELFQVLRVLVDRPDRTARYLILGSASPDIVRGASETLAGRAEFVELSGFNLVEVGPEHWAQLWVRGGFPRSFLAASDDDSATWREGFVRTFLERDIPQLGIRLPAVAMRRFWTMLAHYHGQTWNASDVGRAMGLSHQTMRSYLDILTGTFMIRQLQPWFANTSKRQVKAPKVYLRDSGLLHGLLGLPDWHQLLGHPRVGASWEGFAVEEVMKAVRPGEAYFWATHAGAELDLLVFRHGRAFGVEAKFIEVPRPTRSMRVALTDLGLVHLWIVHPGRHSYAIEDRITALAVSDLPELPARMATLT
jgi:uncharacterized protein